MFQAPPRASAPPMKLDMRKWESLTVKEQDAVRKLPFPRKLHYILGQEDLLQQCGPNGLRKAGTKEQMETMLNKYCNTSKYESFLRQLSVYGFKRTQVDDYKDVYQHEDFIIGNYERIDSIERLKTPRKKRNARRMTTRATAWRCRAIWTTARQTPSASNKCQLCGKHANC